MRFVLFKIFFSLLPFAIWAQQNRPTHFTGKYTYGEKEGLNATNWDDICQLPDGSLVLRPYTQKLVHLINNKAIPVTYDSISNANYNSTFSYNGSGRWFVSNAGISELVNNQLLLKYPLPGNCIQVEFNNYELMVAADLSGHPRLYHLKDGKLTTIATPPDLMGRAVFLTRDNYTGLPVLLPTSKLPGQPFLYL